MDETHREPSGRRLASLSLSALGVVLGDIGTSPIYAMREAFSATEEVLPNPENVLGVLSLIFWALMIIITFKYLFLVMRADNHGEGGIIALSALAAPSRNPTRRHHALMMVGLFGSALFYGDSMITPAISVLSATEGLQVATPAFAPFVVPLAVGILVALFLAQSRGTARVGAVFGPVMLIWFTVLGVLGAHQILQHPEVLAAVDPRHAITFLLARQFHGYLVLGAVFLVVTGGEALYADMGHFGRRAIRVAWLGVALPALLLNYFGQGALVLGDPTLASHPFFEMAPRWALYPLVALCTVATVIASQAVISGAFSLTRQAVQLGYLPRLHVRHTSEKEIGQIYLPAVNWLLMVSCIGLVIGFQSSDGLAEAYGVAVTTHMVFTTVLFAVVAWRRWNWNPLLVVTLVASLLAIDLVFWTANLQKIPQGGWFPLTIAGLLFVCMTTWKRGRQIVQARLAERMMPLDAFVKSVALDQPTRVPGIAVFLDSNSTATPAALLHNLKHNWVLHQRVVFLTVVFEEVPYVEAPERFEIRELGEGMTRIVVHCGFAERTDIPALLRRSGVAGLDFDPMRTSYFLGRERVLSTRRPGMARWRERLFAFMSQNAEGVTRYFELPPNRVVELGMQVEI